MGTEFQSAGAATLKGLVLQIEDMYEPKQSLRETGPKLLRAFYCSSNTFNNGSV